jgi:branched-chain amino acid transport system substrate-binding protein
LAGLKVNVFLRSRRETMQMRQRVLASAAVAVACAAFLAVSAVPADAAGPCELKIGAIGPLAGPAAEWGLTLVRAAELAAAEANAAGGLQVGDNKCHVTIVTYDSKYTAEGAAAGTNSFVSQRIKFIIGPIGSPEITGLKPVAARNNLLVFGDGYAKNAIGPQWPLVFHESPGPSGWADAIIKVAKTKFKMKSVAIIAPNDQGGTDIASVDAVAYKANGIDAIEEYYQRGTTNFAPIVTRLLSHKTDAIDIASAPPTDGGTLMKQLRQAGFKGPIGRLGGPAFDEILRVVGSLDTIKDFYWYDSVPVADAQVKKMWDDYKKLMGSNPPENTSLALWAACSRMLLKAITKAGTIDDTQKVAEALRALPVEDPYLGKGAWIGKKFYGINQELSYPFGMGMVIEGKLLPIQRMPATME